MSNWPAWLPNWIPDWQKGWLKEWCCSGKPDLFAVLTAGVMRIHSQLYFDWIFSTPFAPICMWQSHKVCPKYWQNELGAQMKGFKEPICVGGTEVMRWSKQVPFCLHTCTQKHTHTFTKPSVITQDKKSSNSHQILSPALHEFRNNSKARIRKCKRMYHRTYKSTLS